ncbi:hypothetical protein [Clostridium sp.]|uniref:hypothetical protein n=1 Tax=Clostridium sp. TaxID=1506 RepID=UPI0032175552
MPSKKSYNRFFIILQEDQKGYGLDSNKTPSGYAKLEIKNDRAKSSFYVQNLKKQKGPYCMILIVQGKSGNELINLGQINIDEGGKADVSNEYDANNVANTNISVEKVQGAAICRMSAEKVSPVMVGFTAGEEIKSWHSCPIARTNDKQNKGIKENSESNREIVKQKDEDVKVIKEEIKPCREQKKEVKEEIKPIKQEIKVCEQEGQIDKVEIKQCKCKTQVERLEINDINSNQEVENKYQRANEENTDIEDTENPLCDKVTQKHNEENSNTKEMLDNSTVVDRKNIEDENEIFEEYEKEIERLKEYRKKHPKKCDKDDKNDEEKKVKKCDYTDKNYPIGHMGDFFKEIVKGLEKVGVNENIKNCFWYKAHVDKLEDMYCVYDYNKYSVVFYPMICYYPYISRHKNFMVGYKCDDEGQLKYIIYAIPGTKKIVDQPYEGKTGFVTFMPEERNGDKGHWLMYYDIKGNTVVVPVKR